VLSHNSTINSSVTFKNIFKVSLSLASCVSSSDSDSSKASNALNAFFLTGLASSTNEIYYCSNNGVPFLRWEYNPYRIFATCL